MKARVWCRQFGHSLVNGNCVTVRGAKFASGQPDFLAVVVMSQSTRVVEAADGGDDASVLRERENS